MKLMTVYMLCNFMARAHANDEMLLQIIMRDRELKDRPAL